MKFHIYRDKKSEWRWRLVSPNGRTIADAGEGYTHKADCRRGIKLVMASVSAKVVTPE